MLILRPLGSVSQAKPRSIVISRRCSSSQRSGSMPVSVLTRVDLPWSTWPAVPITYIGSARDEQIAGRRDLIGSTYAEIIVGVVTLNRLRHCSTRVGGRQPYEGTTRVEDWAWRWVARLPTQRPSRSS